MKQDCYPLSASLLQLCKYWLQITSLAQDSSSRILDVLELFHTLRGCGNMSSIFICVSSHKWFVHFF